jgi:ankyrin repeat protein
LEKRGNTDFPGKQGETPLHIAARRGREECGTLLLEAGADIRTKNNKGETPCDMNPEMKPIVLDFLRKRLFRERIVLLTLGQRDKDNIFQRLPIELIRKIIRHSMDGDPKVVKFE